MKGRRVKTSIYDIIIVVLIYLNLVNLLNFSKLNKVRVGTESMKNNHSRTFLQKKNLSKVIKKVWSEKHKKSFFRILLNLIKILN